MVSIMSPEAEIRYGGRTWAGDVSALYTDITRIKDPGFEPKIGFEEGAMTMIARFEDA